MRLFDTEAHGYYFSPLIKGVKPVCTWHRLIYDFVCGLASVIHLTFIKVCACACARLVPWISRPRSVAPLRGSLYVTLTPPSSLLVPSSHCYDTLSVNARSPLSLAVHQPSAGRSLPAPVYQSQAPRSQPKQSALLPQQPWLSDPKLDHQTTGLDHQTSGLGWSRRRHWQ